MPAATKASMTRALAKKVAETKPVSVAPKALKSPSPWTVLNDNFTLHDISLSRTLQGGQCFTWRRLGPDSHIVVDNVAAAPKTARRGASLIASTASTSTALSTSHPSYIGAFRNDVVQLGYDSSTGRVIARAFTTPSVGEALRKDLLHYLSADEDLGQLLVQWRSSKHPITELLPQNIISSKRATNLSGSSVIDSPVRLLKQDFIECLFSFLCSQNNHVKRIAGMVLRLGEAYGTPLGFVTVKAAASSEGIEVSEGADENTVVSPPPRKMRTIEKLSEGQALKRGHKATAAKSPEVTVPEDVNIYLFAFPTLEQLKRQCKDEDGLRGLGFGYRARYVIECAKQLTPEVVGELLSLGNTAKDIQPTKNKSAAASKGKQDNANENWAERTSKITEEKRRILMSLCGVGRKVADCVLLFSLGERTLVPIDTHMAQLATKYFGSELVPLKSTEKSKENVNPKAVATKKASMEEELKELTLTPAMHNKMQTCFLQAFGKEAGWAHSFLFADRIGEQV